MSKREWKLFLNDMKASCRKILAYTKGMDKKSFNSNHMAVDAVIRNFEILGEACNNLPDEIKKKNPGVPWRQITAFRNRIIHEYFGISMDIVWEIIQDDIPELKKKLGKVK